MKKIIYLFLLTIFISGCTATYELKINNDLSVNETIIGLESEKFYNQFYDNKRKVADKVKSIFNEYINQNEYIISEVEEDSLYGLSISKHYANFKEYLEKSIIYIPYFNKLDIIDKNGKIIISLNDKIIDDSFSNRYVVDDGKISIIVPFKVTKHNADNYDMLTNKYTWNFDLTDRTKKNIYIEFDKNVLINHIYLYIVGIAFLILIIICLSVFIKKNIKRNKI